MRSIRIGDSIRLSFLKYDHFIVHPFDEHNVELRQQDVRIIVSKYELERCGFKLSMRLKKNFGETGIRSFTDDQLT